MKVVAPLCDLRASPSTRLRRCRAAAWFPPRTRIPIEGAGFRDAGNDGGDWRVGSDYIVGVVIDADLMGWWRVWVDVDV